MRPPSRTTFALFVSTMSADAQAPLVEENVSIRMALIILDGAIEQCAKDGNRVSVVIVDRSGNVAASIRGDGSNPDTMVLPALRLTPPARAVRQRPSSKRLRINRRTPSSNKFLVSWLSEAACRSRPAMRSLAALASRVLPAARMRRVRTRVSQRSRRTFGDDRRRVTWVVTRSRLGLPSGIEPGAALASFVSRARTATHRF